jgi:hypothetical protein
MASILKVDTIQAPNGTEAITVDTSGVVDMSNTVMYDMYRLTSNVTSSGTATAWEKPDNTGNVTVGDSMSVSSGIFTFPRTGVYRVAAFANIENENGDDSTSFDIQHTRDNSSYTIIGLIQSASDDSSAFVKSSGSMEVLVNITDTANHKIRFAAGSVGSGSQIIGNTDRNQTAVTFQYIAPAQS